MCRTEWEPYKQTQRTNQSERMEINHLFGIIINITIDALNNENKQNQHDGRN